MKKKKSSLFNLYALKPEWIIGLIILLGSWASLAQTPINDPNDGACHFAIQYVNSEGSRKIAPRTVCENSTWEYSVGGWRPAESPVHYSGLCIDEQNSSPHWEWQFKGANRWRYANSTTWNNVNSNDQVKILFLCPDYHVNNNLIIEWGPASNSAFIELLFHKEWAMSLVPNVCNGGIGMLVGDFQPNMRIRTDIYINSSNTQTEDWYFVNGNTTNCGAFSSLLFKYIGAHDFEQYSYQLSQDALDNGYYLDPVANEKEVLIKNNGTPIAGTYTINYSMIKGCASGLVQVTSAKQFVVNTSTVNEPVINQEEICSFSTVLVHTGSQNGPETGYQGSEFEIESGPVPVFSLNGEKTIVRNEGNAPIWIGGAPEGSTFRVRVRKIYACGTSPWSPYSTFKVNYYTPVALKRLSNETFVCRNDIFEVGLEMPVADSELPSNITYDFEVVSSAAQIRDGVSGSLGSLVSLTTNKFVTVNTANIPANNNTPVIIRAKANYACRSTSWVTCTLQVGGVIANDGFVEAVQSGNNPLCENNLVFRFYGVDEAIYSKVNWLAEVSANPNGINLVEAIVTDLSNGKFTLIKVSPPVEQTVNFVKLRFNLNRCGTNFIPTRVMDFSTGGQVCSPNSFGQSGPCILPLVLDCGLNEDPLPTGGGKRLLADIPLNIQKRLSLYPNPANERVFIKGLEGSFDYQILNSLGQIMQTGNSESEILINKLPAGTYLLRTTQNNQTLTQRFVKL